jgi:membrane protease YdiL (CAAX protease family)
MVIVQAVLFGMLIMIAGTIPRNLLFAANLRLYPAVPWAVPVTAVYLWFFWRYLQGKGPPDSTAEERRTGLRANRVSGRVWAWALLAGGLGIVALVLALRVANRMVVLPPQQLPDLGNVPKLTVLSLLLMAAPVAGIIEEAAFRGYMQGPIERRHGMIIVPVIRIAMIIPWRGYMQGPIERRHGMIIAILITGTMFAVAHLDFTLILWPYYVAVAAIYGIVTLLTKSILPAVVLHTCGNLYSNLDLWLHGKAEWQAAAGPAALIWKTGGDAAFWRSSIALLLVTAVAVWTYFKLARVARRAPP